MYEKNMSMISIKTNPISVRVYPTPDRSQRPWKHPISIVNHVASLWKMALAIDHRQTTAHPK